MSPDAISGDMKLRLNTLNAVALKRGQSLAQMAIAGLLQNKGVTSALIGACKPEQNCVGALKNLSFERSELKEISQILI